MSYAADDGPAAPSSLDGQPLDDDDDDDVDDGACVVYNSSSTSKHNRDKYKRYNRRSRSADKQYAMSSRTGDSHSPSRTRDYYAKHRRRERSRHRRSRSRSRSTSRRRHHARKRRRDGRKSRRTRSRSRSRYSRSRSQRSRSRSRAYYSRCRRSRSRCCRCNGSCSCSSTSSTYSDRDTSSLYRKYIREVPKDQDYIRKVYAKHDEVPVQENSFKNDGSFLEMFKKMQEDKAAEEKKDEPVPAASVGEEKKAIPIFGKRRGGRVLKTGLVQKIKSSTEVEEEPKDAWSVYMMEVKRYKEACCDDDSKTRPLVK